LTPSGPTLRSEVLKWHAGLLLRAARVRIPPDRRSTIRNRLNGRTRASEARYPGSNPGSGTETGHVCPAFSDNPFRRRRINQPSPFSEVGMWQANTVVTRVHCTFDSCPRSFLPVSHSRECTSFVTRLRVVRLHSPAPTLADRAQEIVCRQRAVRLQVRSSVFQTD
jgi:hypothetical protein